MREPGFVAFVERRRPTRAGIGPGRLENRVFALVERLDEDPIMTEVVNSETGDRADAQLTGIR